MKLLTLILLAPMFAGAQVKIDTSLYTADSGLSFYDTTAYEQVHDTTPVHLLVVDTCGGSVYAQYVKGYKVYIGKRYTRSGMLFYNSASFFFLNSRKQRLGKCHLVWDYKN